ncbi:MAG: class I SAM-dependent methyltransferase [Anaerolineales bacterium]
MPDKIIYELEYRTWSNSASEYDDLFAAVSTQAIGKILENLGQVQGKHHLDIACGTGHLVAAASQRGAISEGVDFVPAMVAAAQANYPAERFQVGDAVALPYEDGAFDLVTCSFGLSHMINPHAAVNEAFRVLKAGGCFAFTLWFSGEDGNTPRAIIKTAIEKYAMIDSEFPQKWSQLREPNPSACEKLTHQAGFSSPVFIKLPIIWRVNTSQEVVNLFMKLSVRTKMLIDLQPVAAQQRIYEYVLSEVEAHRTNGFIPLDWPALLTVVQKPKSRGRVISSKHLEPKHTVFNSIEKMLAPVTLSELLSQSITRVDYQPLTDHGGVAGSRISYVITNAGRFVLKQMSLEHDWNMYASDDQQSRSVKLWQYGLLDQMSPYLKHQIIACAREGDVSTILMHDLTDQTFKDWLPMSQDMALLFLDTLAKLHAAFWNDPLLNDTRLGLCDTVNWLNISSLQLAQGHQGEHRGPLPSWVREGWQLMEEVLDADVFTQISHLRKNPQPLLEMLALYPYTLLHGDYASRNLAYQTPNAIVFDWQLAGPSLMTVDLIWFTDNVSESIEPDQAIRYYRERLEEYLKHRFDDMDWQAMVQLGGIVVALMMMCFPVYLSKIVDDPERRLFFEHKVKVHSQRIRDSKRLLTGTF